VSYADPAFSQINELLDQLAPEAIALTDAWDFSDASVASAIGMKDGNVYERLMSWTRQLPTNVRARRNGGQLPGIWDEYLKPVLKAKL
jgi:acyl-CoA oxidase